LATQVFFAGECVTYLWIQIFINGTYYILM
jgi:hypothetical protein